MNETNHPARRLRHGERPTEPLVFDDAAANKAAEEGGLPERISQLIFDNTSLGWDKASNLATAVLVFVEADRASRQAGEIWNAIIDAHQVANKAEVEPIGIHCREFHELAMTYRAAPPFRCASDAYEALTAHIDQHVESQVQAALATPPATTGASTARDQALEDAAEAIDAMNDASGDAAAYDNREQNLFELEREHAISACAEKVRSLMGSVGASTVLTDERTSIDTPEMDRLLVSYSMAVRAGESAQLQHALLIAHIDQHVAREVAAQAGQVAVPEKMVLMPKEPSHLMIAAMACSQAKDDEGEFPSMLDLLDFSGENKACAVLKAAYHAAVAAAPSPAKESK